MSSRVWQARAIHTRLAPEENSEPFPPAIVFPLPLRLEIRCGNCGHWWTDETPPTDHLIVFCPKCGRALSVDP